MVCICAFSCFLHLLRVCACAWRLCYINHLTILVFKNYFNSTKRAFYEALFPHILASLSCYFKSISKDLSEIYYGAPDVSGRKNINNCSHYNPSSFSISQLPGLRKINVFHFCKTNSFIKLSNTTRRDDQTCYRSK